MPQTPEELTAEWKAGKLESGLYWVKFKGKIVIAECAVFGDVSKPFKIKKKTDFIIKISKVLAPCNYDEYKAMQAELAELKEKIKKREELIQCLGSNIDELDVKKSVLIIENNKLRGLLKECKEELEYHSELIFCELESDNSKIEFKHLLTHINAALGGSEVK